MNLIGKNSKRYNAKSSLIIKRLASKYEVTESFVRLSIKGDRDSNTANAIKKEYNKLIIAIDKVLN